MLTVVGLVGFFANAAYAYGTFLLVPGSLILILLALRAFIGYSHAGHGGRAWTRTVTGFTAVLLPALLVSVLPISQGGLGAPRRGLCSSAARSRARRMPRLGVTAVTAGPSSLARCSGRGRLSGVIFVITEPCIGTKDASCVEVCPVNCIHEGEDQYYIDPDECIGCSACATVCPVNAIYDEDEVPEQWRSFVEKNAAFFKK